MDLRLLISAKNAASAAFQQAAEQVKTVATRAKAAASDLQKLATQAKAAGAGVQKAATAAAAATKTTASAAVTALNAIAAASKATAGGLQRVAQAARAATPSVRAVVTSVVASATVAAQRLGSLALQFQAVQRAAANGGSGRGGGGFGGLTQGLRSLSDLAGRALNTILGVTRRLTAGVLEMAAQITGRLVGAFQALAGAAAGAAAIIGGTLLAALTAAGKSGVDMNVTVQRATVALTKITGTAAGAKMVIGQLEQESQESALTFKDLIPLGQQLAAVYGASGLGKVLPTIRAFGDVAATLGVSQEDQKLAQRGFRQLANAPKPEMGDINQIDDALPGSGVRNIMRDAFGTADTEELQKAGVTGMMVADAIVKGFQARFGGAQKELAGTLPIILSNFGDAWNRLTSAVTAKFTPQLTAALGQVLTVFQGLASNESLISALAVPFELLGNILQRVAAELPRFTEWLTGILTRENVVNVLSQIAGWAKTLTDEVLRFINAATGGKGFVGVWEAFSAAAKAALDVVVRLWNGFVAGVQYLAEHSGELWGMMADAMKPVQAVLETIVGGVTVLVGLLAGGKLAEGVSNLGAIGQAVATALGLGGGGAAMRGGGAAALGGGMRFGGPMGVAVGTLGVGAAVAGGELKSAQEYADWIETQSKYSRTEKDALKRVNTIRVGNQGVSGAINRFGRSVGMGAIPEKPNAQDEAIVRKIMEREGTLGGPLGQLQGIGRNVLGSITGAAGDAYNSLPGRVRNFGEGFVGAVRRGASTGADDLLGRVGANSQAARTAIQGALIPRGSVTDSGLPPSIQLYGAGGGGAAASPAVQAAQMSGKALKAHLAATKALIEARMDMVRAQVEAQPETERAFAELRMLVPALQSKQQTLAQEMRLVGQHTKEYANLVSEWWQSETQVQKIRENASKAQLEGAKKAYSGKREVMDAKLGLVQAQLKHNPFLNDGQRKAGLVPFLAERFRALQEAAPGETEADKYRRLTDAENVKGDIQENLGMTGPGAFARTLGGGMLPMYDVGRANRTMRSLGGVNFAPTVNAGPSPEELRRTLYGLVDQMVRGSVSTPSY